MQILFLVKDQQKTDFTYSNWNNKKRFINCASKSQAEVVITSWNHLVIRRGKIYAKKGIVKKGSKEKQIKRSKALNPAYIHTHVAFNPTENLIIDKENIECFRYLLKQKLVNNNSLHQSKITNIYIQHLTKKYWKKAKVSYNRSIACIGKYYLEKYFKAAEKEGIQTNRPKTTLITKTNLQILQNLSKQQTLIVKSHAGTRCNGLYIINQNNYEDKIQEIKRSKDQLFVAQEFIKESYLYNKRKSDLRIYVGITSWYPLKFKVYRQGLTRISNKDFNEKEIENTDKSTTTMSLLNEKLEHNLRIDEYFDSIKEIENDQIWKKIDTTIEDSLKAILKGSKIANDQLANTIYMLGYDILLSKSSNELKPLILEINHFPTLYRSATNDPNDKVNSALDKTYTEFFKDIVENA